MFKFRISKKFKLNFFESSTQRINNIPNYMDFSNILKFSINAFCSYLGNIADFRLTRRNSRFYLNHFTIGKTVKI